MAYCMNSSLIRVFFPTGTERSVIPTLPEAQILSSGFLNRKYYRKTFLHYIYRVVETFDLQLLAVPDYSIPHEHVSSQRKAEP